MSDDLDDFLRSREDDRAAAQNSAQEAQTNRLQNQRFLAEHAKAEWARLKNLVREKSAGKSVDGSPFRGTGGSLVLNNVAASFDDGMVVNQIPRHTSIVFSRNPYGGFAEESIVDPETWQVEPNVENESITWRVAGSRFSLSSDDLASEVVKKLVTYSDEYESAYGR
jgi:hypothetical protein